MRSLGCVGRAIAAVLVALVGLALAPAAGVGEPAAPRPADAGTALAAGGLDRFATLGHTCALRAGHVYCWGAADRGQTGDGSLARRRPYPVRVAGLPEAVHSLAAGGAHTCAATDAAVWCWGRTGDGPPLENIAPKPVDGVSGAVTALAAGPEHDCAVVDGRVVCWGRTDRGQAGQEPPARCRRGGRCRAAPAPVKGIPAAPAALALGSAHGCALAGGAVHCWGANEAGQRGDASAAVRPGAARVALAGTVDALAAGERHTCALAQGAVLCWGGGADGSDPALAAVPQRVPLPGSARVLGAGGERSCAALEAGVWCWAVGGAPAPVAGVTGRVTALALGPDHACARSDGQVHCWGENDWGQLGDGQAPRGRATAAPVVWDDGRLHDRDGDGVHVLVCLGDSNTRARERGPVPWCDRLPALLPDDIRVVNRGEGGAVATPGAGVIEAAEAVAYTVENDAPDLAILAYGTNDVLADVPAMTLVLALAQHARRLLEHGAEVLVATVPPQRRSAEGETDDRVAEVNRILRAAFGDRVVDLSPGFDAAALADRVHLTDAAQAQRARAAAEEIARRFRLGAP